jgi:hypothetical protein
MSKSKDLIKKHTESVAHNTLGNIITVGLSLGGAAVMSWFTAHAAFIFGLPLFVVLIVGVAVFFFLALAAYLIDTIIVRRRRLQAGAIDEPKQLEAFNSELSLLKLDHAEEIEGRSRAFKDLQRKNEVLQERLNDWEKYDWLVSIATTHAQDIDQYVKLDRIERGDMQLNDGVPFVKFGIYVANDSVLDVTLELERGSYILFRGQKLVAPIDVVTDGLRCIKFQTVRCLVIEQRLTREEAHFISGSEARDDAIFFFDRLTLTIKGHRQTPSVTPKRLDMNKGVTLHNEPLTFRP